MPAPEEIKILVHRYKDNRSQYISSGYKETEVSTPEKTERTEREIRATDMEIDALVYELYGLTSDEVGVVEGEC